jgi:hypothetical protein
MAITRREKVAKRLRAFNGNKKNVYPGIRKIETQNVPRPLMFARIKIDVKKEFEKRTVFRGRKDMRLRLISLTRRTMRMMREKGAHKAR